jgi:hypothetical protein
MAKRMIELELYIFTTTDRAIMVGRDEDDETESIWLPKRAVDPLEGYELEESVEPIPMLVPEALALQKGLI